jgi:hypothetical protein
MRMQRDQMMLAGAIGVVVAISIALAWTLDLAPDQSSHLAVIRHHADQLAWMTPDQWQYGPERGHGYHLFSPVPYIPYLPFQFLENHFSPFGDGDPSRFFVRLGGITIAIAQLLATMAVVRRMCRACGRVEIVGVALAANLIPQLRYIHAYPNSDAITILAASIAVALCLRILQTDRVTLVDAGLVGLTLGLAAHGRYTGFLVAGALLIVYVVRLLLTNDAIRTKLRFVGVAVALPVLLAAPLHLHVYNELDNRHVLASADNEQLADSTFRGELRTTPPASTFVKQRVREIPTVWMTTWLWFATYAELRGVWLDLLFVGCVAGATGIVLGRRRTFTPTGRWVALGALAAFILTWVVSAFQRYSDLPGRFLLPAGVTAFAAGILGCGELLARATRARRPVLLAAAMWAVLLAGLNLWGLGRVLAA